MEIRIRSFAMIREIIGQKSIKFRLEAATTNIMEVLQLLLREYPDLQGYLFPKQQLNANFIFAINGQRLSNEELDDYLLKDHDELAILPPAGGG